MIDEAEITENKSKDNIKLPVYWLDLAVGVFIFFASLCKINDPVFLFGSLSAVFFVWRLRKYPIIVTWLDAGILLIWLYHLAMIFLSSEIISSFFAFKKITLNIVYYFILRICFNDIQKIKSLLWANSLIIAILCVVSVITFYMFKGTSEFVGFTGLYDFRHLYKPLGYLSNVWGSLLIGFMGVVSLAMFFHRYNKGKAAVLYVVFMMILFGIIVSFSRGVYVSGVFLLLSLAGYLIFSKISPTQKGIICIAVLLPLFLFGILFGNDVIKTVKFNETVSQQRSISGRIESMQATDELFQESPLFGSGAGTYSMVINDYRYENDNSDFTNFAPNSYIQIIIEQGIAGLLIWGLLIFILMFIILKNWTKTIIPKIILVFIIAILIREATFPVFPDTAGFQLLIFTLLAILQNTSVHKLQLLNIAPSRAGYLFVFMAIVMILSGIYSIVYKIEEDNNRMALVALQNGNLDDAQKFIDKTTGRIPYLINKSIIDLELYKQRKDTLFLNNAKSNLEKSMSKNKHDVMLRYCMAFVLREEGKLDSALNIIKNLAEQFPNKSLYQFASFNILYKQDQKEAAVPYLIQTIKLHPAILDNPYWAELQKNDSLFIQLATDGLLLDICSQKENNTDRNPVLIARYGKILLSMKQEKEAQQLLEESITLLPNIMYPRYYLSKIDNNSENKVMYLRQCAFLSSGIPSKDHIDQMVNSNELDKRIANRSFVVDNYKTKFETWYHSSTAIKIK